MVISFAGIFISWPVFGIIALYTLRTPLLGIIRQFGNEGMTKAKFGPVELERQIVDLNDRVKGQQEVQDRENNELELLRFLVLNFVTGDELAHLRKLSGADEFTYRRATYFEAELRRLRSLGLISSVPIATMPEERNLKNHFKITTDGLNFLKLREIDIRNEIKGGQ